MARKSGASANLPRDAGYKKRKGPKKNIKKGTNNGRRKPGTPRAAEAVYISQRDLKSKVYCL